MIKAAGKKINILVLLTAGLLFVDVILFILIAKVSDSWRLTKRQVLVVNKELQNLDSVYQQRQQVGTRIETLLKILPKNDVEFAAFAASITNSAANIGLSLNMNIAEQNQTAKGEQTVGIELELNGTFTQVVDFFDRLYLLPYDIVIDQLTIDEVEHGVKTAVKLSLYTNR